MIEARDLTKRYGSTVAVDALSFDVRPGSVTGFLGPNGSGKSTTMRLILGLDRPDAGQVRVGGRRYRELRWPLREVGALLEARAFHPGRSARSHLAALAASNAIPRARVDEVLDMVGLASAAGRRAGKFSLGMGQRLGVAAALLGDPAVLLLDEPVNGLDPEGVRWIRNLLKSLAAQGRTVLVSSHLISEMALTAERLVVIGRGRLLADTTVAELSAGSASLEDAFFRLTSGAIEYRVDHGEGGNVMTTTAETRVPGGRYGLAHAARMEWIKLRSLRSTWWTLAVTVAEPSGIAVAVAAEHQERLRGPDQQHADRHVRRAAAGRRSRRAGHDQRVHLGDDPGHARRRAAAPAGAGGQGRGLRRHDAGHRGGGPFIAFFAGGRRCAHGSRRPRWASPACCARCADRGRLLPDRAARPGPGRDHPAHRGRGRGAGGRGIRAALVIGVVAHGVAAYMPLLILENSLSTTKPVTCGTDGASCPHFLSAWAGLGVLCLYAAIALAAGGWLLARRDA